MQNTGFSTNKTLNINGRLINLDRPKVMGILNVTPDSFYDGGRFISDEEILQQAEKMIAEGADFIDVGGYSTRPGAREITSGEESDRALNAISLIKKHFPETLISIDTFRSTVAEAGVREGAVMINDVSGGQLDPLMFTTVARLNVPYVLMHMRGNPQTMLQHTQYDDLVRDIVQFLQAKISELTDLGVKDIIVDPGFGFAKTREHNFMLLDQLEYLKVLGRPVLAGLSRKSMIWKTLQIKPEEALNGTTALHAIALLKGVSIIRVHDVKASVEVVKLIHALKEAAK